MPVAVGEAGHHDHPVGIDHLAVMALDARRHVDDDPIGHEHIAGPEIADGFVL